MSMPMQEQEDGPACAVIWVHGRIQGVGFRWWVRARALELGLVGHARNASDGRVEILVQGAPAQIRRLVEMIEEKPTQHLRPGEVSRCLATWGPPKDTLEGFVER
jgi:acylphosphatase